MMLFWGSLALFGIYGFIALSRRKKLQRLQSGQSDWTKVKLQTFVQAQRVCNPSNVDNFRKLVVQRGMACIVLAAGEGSRFKASVPKVIYPFNGKPLALYALEAARKVIDGAIPTIFVVGYEKELVLRTLGKQLAHVTQETRMGTGHAVYLVKSALPRDFSGDVIITYADNPGVDSSLLDRLIECHKRHKQQIGKKYAALILTGRMSYAGVGANAYGRIIRDSEDNVVDIVEKKQIDRMEDGSLKHFGCKALSKQQLYQIEEFNSGIVIARSKPYFDALGNIYASQTRQDPPKYEYYATDFVSQLRSKGFLVKSFLIPEQETWKLEGANTVEELDKLGAKFWALGGNR
ncbi:Bifunctional protein GlmU [Galdieria sulphuraria]|nr:Bifunctional protein GlmU [Galdieria sulphuraria]